MQLIIYNGSPRNKKSNSKLLIEHFLKGYNSINNENVKINYLAETKKAEEHKSDFMHADVVLIIFPLYADSMPGVVKYFIENIYNIAFHKPKKIGFIVQSGFPEAIHSVSIEKYLKKLTQRIQCDYLGTIIKGGVEGIQIQPKFMTKKLFSGFEQLGKTFAETGNFDENIKAKFAKPYKMSPFGRFVFKMISYTGLTNFYWNSNLKKNKAYEKRFDKPYAN